MKKGIGFAFILGIFLLSFVAATPNYVISNSADWKDVYSSLLYANLNGLDSDFLVSESHGPVLLDGLDKDYSLIIITSKNNPLVLNYPALAKSKGFNSVEEKQVSSANLELINDMPNINNFIVVSDSYGYDAMAVIAYAMATNSWVFLADRSNIDQIDSILTSRNTNKLLLYGYVDSEVTSALSKYNPEIINTGNKFSDNVEIVKKYSQVGSISQVLLSNGEFIEKEIMQGKNTLLFTGDENVPDVITNYIKSSNIQIGVLIGNELIGAATNIRQSTGINVMVKSGRSARERTSGVSPVQGLDLFYITPLNTELSAPGVEINKTTVTPESLKIIPNESQLNVLNKKDNFEDENGNNITIKNKINNNLIGEFEFNGVKAKSEVELESNFENNRTEIKARLYNRNETIKIMPDTASENAILVLGLKFCNESNNCIIILKDVKLRDESSLKYEVQAKKRVSFLFFHWNRSVKAYVDAETGFAEKA